MIDISSVQADSICANRPDLLLKATGRLSSAGLATELRRQGLDLETLGRPWLAAAKYREAVDAVLGVAYETAIQQALTDAERPSIVLHSPESGSTVSGPTVLVSFEVGQSSRLLIISKKRLQSQQ